MRAIVSGTVYTMAGPVLPPGTGLVDPAENVDVGERLVVPSDADVVVTEFLRVLLR